MKIWCITGSLFLLLIACRPSADFSILVEGLAPYEGYQAYLMKEDLNDPSLTDTISAGVVRHEKVILRGTLESPDQVTLVVTDNERFPVIYRFILETGKLQLYPDKQQEFIVAGGKYNDEIINSWKNTSTYDSLMQLYKSKNTSAKTKEERSQVISLFREITKLKSEALTTLAQNASDPMSRLLATISGATLKINEKLEIIEQTEQKMGETPTSRRWKAFYQGQQQREELKRQLRSGGQYIDFTAPDLQGNTYRVKDVLKNNRYILIEFWASWCKPCRTEIPHLKEAYEKYHPKGFEIISYSLDKEKQNWLRASTEEALPWLNLSDLKGPGSSIVNAYAVDGIPANFMIETTTGKIIATDLRQKHLSEELAKRMD
ncbi:MAG: peroxiredoxin family protein [Odoribacter splanchnicus]